MSDSFGTYCNRLLGQYNDNMKRLVEDSTEMIFNITLKNPTLQIRKTINGEIRIGKFYIIQYNYNGNKIWCPILVIDDRYSSELQKRIIYAVNFDYLPYRYKIIYLDKLFKMFSDVIEKNRKNNDGGNSVNEEASMKINFESIYNSLKNNGNFNYAISAYDYSKIVGIGMGGPQIYGVSTTILSRFIFIDTKIINKRVMMDALKDSEVETEKEKLKELLLAYEKTAFDYDNDVKEYYENLKLLESHYKFYENPK